MAITYKWRQETIPENPNDRTIVASEQVSETKEEVFSISQREKELEDAKLQVVSAQQKVADLEKEILAVKTALVIK